MEGTALLVETGHVFYILIVILLAAKLAEELFERIGQPAVLGELVAGVIVGTSAGHRSRGSRRPVRRCDSRVSKGAVLNERR